MGADMLIQGTMTFHIYKLYASFRYRLGLAWPIVVSLAFPCRWSVSASKLYSNLLTSLAFIHLRYVHVRVLE